MSLTASIPADPSNHRRSPAHPSDSRPPAVGAVAVVGSDPDVVSQSQSDIAQQALHLGMGPIGFGFAARYLDGGLFAHLCQIAFPGRDAVGPLEGRRRVTASSYVEHEACDRAQIVREEVPMLGVEPQDARPHRKIVGPATELHLGAGDGVVALDDRGVEGRRDRRVQEIQQVRRFGAQTKPLILRVSRAPTASSTCSSVEQQARVSRNRPKARWLSASS